MRTITSGTGPEHPQGPIVADGGKPGLKTVCNELILRANRDGITDLTKFKMSKILYVLESEHRRAFSEPLLAPSWQAWERGPAHLGFQDLTRNVDPKKPVRVLMSVAEPLYPIIDTSSAYGRARLALIESVWGAVAHLPGHALANAIVQRGSAHNEAWSARRVGMKHELIGTDPTVAALMGRTPQEAHVPEKITISAETAEKVGEARASVLAAELSQPNDVITFDPAGSNLTAEVIESLGGTIIAVGSHDTGTGDKDLPDRVLNAALGLPTDTNHAAALGVVARLREHAETEYIEVPASASPLHEHLAEIRAAREYEHTERERTANARAAVETALSALIMAGIITPDTYKDEDPALIAQALRAASEQPTEDAAFRAKHGRARPSQAEVATAVRIRRKADQKLTRATPAWIQNLSRSSEPNR